MKLKTLLLCLLTIPTVIFCQDINLDRHQIFVGFEGYHLHRNKEGGTKQEGDLIGFRVSYDRLKRCAWYWGGDFLYAGGRLHGHAGFGGKLRSDFRDLAVEGRGGFTFQTECFWQAAFTPFVGLGYYEERNNFVHPSILQLHFRTRFPYAVAGFLSRIHPCENFEIGLNFKVRYPWEPHCHVSRHREISHIKQRVKERFQFRVELPLAYSIPCDQRIAISLIPFYEYRHYGSHPNFPFDFFKTQFTVYGAELGLQFRL